MFGKLRNNMSVPEFSTPETTTTTGSAHMDILNTFSSCTIVSPASPAPPATVAAPPMSELVDDGHNSNEDVTQKYGISSSAIGLLGLGRDIGCDFNQHSSSSERSSTGSPGLGLNSFTSAFGNVQQTPTTASITVTTTAAGGSTTAMKNAGVSSSPSASSSEPDSSSHHSRASSKSAATSTTSTKPSAVGGLAESNKAASGLVSPISPLGDFRCFDLANEMTTGRNSAADNEETLWSGQSATMNCQYCHRPYRQPRLLFCLHSFCEDCIVAMLEGRSDEAPSHELDVELEPTKSLIAKPPPGVVRCPVCKQDSNVGNDLRFVQLLTMDYVAINSQDANAMEHAQLSCESCKAKEQAVAHCFDCSSFLCPNCVKAHQYMRCFENHKVLTVEQIKESGDGLMIHRPILCQEHAGEQMRYFCATCKMPMCIKCTHTTHKGGEHTCEEVGGEMEDSLRKDLKQLVDEGRQKVQACEGASRELSDKVRTVQDRAESAVQAVEEAFNAYMQVLTRHRDDMIQEIGQAHARVEEDIMNTFSRIGNMSEKINDALSFTERLLRCGNAMEILYTRKAVRDQLTCLIRGIPSTNVAINLRFVTDAEKFERAMKDNFGVIRTEIEPQMIQRVNVDELLKKINTVSSVPNQAQSAAGASQTMRNDPTASMNAFVGGGPVVANSAFVPFDGGARTGGGNLLQSTVDEGAIDYFKSQARNFTGHMDLGGWQGSGGPSTNNSNISPTSQMVSARPPSSVSGMMTNHSTNASSPIDSGFGTYGLLNGMGGGNGSGVRLANMGGAGGGGNGGLPNLSMPPPTPIVIGTAPRRSSPVGGYDMANQLAYGMQQPSSMFGNVTVQPGLVGASSMSSGLTPPIRNAQMTQMQTKSRFGQLGPAQGQFNSPHGFCLNEAEEIAVADTNNHRIQVFTLNGEFRAQFGIPGKEDGQLWYPRKVAYLRSNGVSPGRYIVCDRGNERSRMQIFTRAGHFIKKIAIRYIDIVAGLAIDPESRIVAVDSVTPTVFCIHESGELVRWFDCADYMREPSDIAVSGNEYFICDFKGHCVCVFSDSGSFLRRVGCEGITNFPNGIDISDHGDVLIGDSHGNRFHVAVYRKSGELTCEFDCPYAKVSRCCGLRITRDGFIVTMSKNNHNVLVLNTLFVT